MKHSLKTRLIVNFVALATIPLLLVSLTVAWLGFTVEQRQSLALEGEVALRVAERMEAHINGMATTLRLTGQNVLAATNQPESPSPSILDISTAALRRLVGHRFHTISLIDDQGRLLEHHVQADSAEPVTAAATAPADLALRDEYVVPMATGLTYYGPVRFTRPGGRPVLTLGVPLMGSLGNEPRAVLIAEASLDSAWTLVKSDHERKGETIYVVDSNRRVIAHRNYNLVLGDTRFTLPANDGLHEGLSGRWTLLATRRFSLGGQVLTVVAERPLAAALSAALGTIGSLAAAFLISLIMAVSLALFTARRVFTPIGDLVRAARAVQAGDLKQRANATSTDELGELATAFNSMTHKLARTMAGLEGKIQELTNAEEKIRDREKAYRELFESSAEGLLVTGRTGQILDANSKSLSMLGYSQQEITALQYADLIDDMNLKTHPLSESMRAMSRGQTVRLERHMKRRNGSLFIADISARTVSESRCQIVIRDISARKRMEAELVAARTVAEEASHAKGEFLANMSHEIRTPISNIMGMIDMTLSTDLSDDQATYLRQVKESAASLLRIINDVLDLSKIEANHMRVVPEDLDLHDLLERLLGSFGPDIQPKGLALTWETEPGVPRYIRTDPDRLAQVLTNLVGNAVKFTDQGSIDVRLSFHNDDPRRPRILFEVADTGIGIPDDAQATLFDHFTQVDSSYSKRYQGTGLGLAICKRLVSMLGGSIWVESEPNHGSTFFFTIAYAAARSAPGPETAQGSRPVRHRNAVRGLRILLAEDNAVNRMFVRNSLAGAGATVTDVGDGQAAVQAAKNTKFDVVLMDITMPGMDGIQAARAIRESHHATPGNGAAPVPIIALTAHAMSEDRRRFLDAGMDDCLAKPFESHELMATIEGVLARRNESDNS